ncbi:MAG: hypothetical protein EOP06_08885 [Proteobacteria bacterium]|nr:MAG: hypothetical protein EOP06_08885 [Pseudomonadota bacterium]
MEKAICSTCLKPKATLACELCHESICKYCAQFLDDEAFAFLPERAPALQHVTYCNNCFTAAVAPQLEAYNATIERAKEILVFTKVQNKETRLIRRDEDVIHIGECDNREQVVMRLAFKAAQENFNAVIDIETVSKKVRNGSYQTTKWTGSGIPAHVNPDRLIRDRSFSTDPN